MKVSSIVLDINGWRCVVRVQTGVGKSFSWLLKSTKFAYSTQCAAVMAHLLSMIDAPHIADQRISRTFASRCAWCGWTAVDVVTPFTILDDRPAI